MELKWELIRTLRASKKKGLRWKEAVVCWVRHHFLFLCLLNTDSPWKENLLPPTSRTEPASCCCGNRISCWPPCPLLSGSDGLWASNGPQRVLQFGSAKDRKKKQSKQNSSRDCVWKKGGGQFNDQTLGACSLEWQLFVVLWVINDVGDIIHIIYTGNCFLCT